MHTVPFCKAVVGSVDPGAGDPMGGSRCGGVTTTFIMTHNHNTTTNISGLDTTSKAKKAEICHFHSTSASMAN